MVGWMIGSLDRSLDKRKMRRMFGRITYCMDNGGKGDVQLDSWLALRMGS